jgi:3-isopropylmalate/(R)-2-methylmalate dehydratase small subunit
MTSSRIKARAHILGNDISLDLILPQTAFDISADNAGLARHAFSGADKTLVSNFGEGDIILAGSNFGVCFDACPNTHLEKTVACLKELKVSCIIAGSFSRLFYRSAINGGLPLIESKEAFRLVKPREEIEIDLLKGEIHHKAGVINIAPLPESLKRIIDAGGLVAYVKRAAGGR